MGIPALKQTTGRAGLVLQGGALGEGEVGLEPVGPVSPGYGAQIRALPSRLDSNDRAALAIWVSAHLALFVLAWAAAWVYRLTRDHASLAGVFEHWDAVNFRLIAQYGYFSPNVRPYDITFFPGYPAVLAAAHLILRSWVLSELAVSGPAIAAWLAATRGDDLAHLGQSLRVDARRRKHERVPLRLVREDVCGHRPSIRAGAATGPGRPAPGLAGELMYRQRQVWRQSEQSAAATEQLRAHYRLWST